MRAVPITREEAAEFVKLLHRHHPPIKADKYRIGCEINGRLVGVVQVGRPVAAALDDGRTLEVSRLCTDGADNVCSFLYSRAARVAKELGYSKIITYILDSENGASLKAAGWRKESDIKGHAWNHKSRPRKEVVICDKQRWAKELI